MIIQIMGGLTSRLDVLSSVIPIDALGQKIDPYDGIQLIWKPQPGVNCHFHDLFTNPIQFTPIESFNLNDYKICTYGSFLNGINAHIYGKCPNLMDELESPIHQKHYLDHYILTDWWMHLNGRISSKESRSKFLVQLIPVPEIDELVKEFSSFWKLQECYGLNIRRGLNTCHYHEEACEKSPNRLFNKKIKSLIKQDYNVKFLVTTDCKNTLDEIREEYPRNTFCNFCRRTFITATILIYSTKFSFHL